MKIIFLLFFAILFLSSCKPELVEPGAAISISNKFFELQSSGEIDSAMSLYDSSFQGNEHTWRKLLIGLYEKAGPVSKSELESVDIAAKE